MVRADVAMKKEGIEVSARDKLLTCIVGEIYRLYLPGGRSIVFANSHRLINELCDEKRFAKKPNGVLEVRDFSLEHALLDAHAKSRKSEMECTMDFSL